MLRGPKVAPVPRAPAGVCGLTNLRGQILPVIDPLGATSEACGLVLRAGSRGAVLRVDQVHGIEAIPRDRFEAVPPTLEAPLTRWARGAVSLDGRLVIWIDAERMVAETVSRGAGARDLDGERLQTSSEGGLRA